MRRKTKKIVLICLIIVVLIASGIVTYFYYNSQCDSVFYKTAKIQRGDLTAAITATGTVEPEELINVGAQIAGQILSFGKDDNGKSIDYGSRVVENMVLAKIDDSLYMAETAQATAQVEQAKAAVKRAEADLEQMKSKMELALRDWNRAKKLRPAEVLAESAFDSFRAAHDSAKANIGVAEAAILQSKGALAYSEAVLKRAQRNLSYCTIKSPVNGIVIDRRVNIGQTVVSSLNAPSLFLIAKDLKRMQLWVAVNEADIGKIYCNQPVSFTVDAFPGKKFTGEVSKVRLNASMTQNVVTYTVEVNTDNSKGELLPYLTANVQFEISHSDNVLTVPNIALRWMPKLDMVDEQYRQYINTEDTEKPRNKDSDNERPKIKTKGKSKTGMIWLKVDNKPKPINVKIGITDGVVSEIECDNLAENMEVITGLQTEKISQSKNPFVPQVRARGMRF